MNDIRDTARRAVAALQRRETLRIAAPAAGALVIVGVLLGVFLPGGSDSEPGGQTGQTVDIADRTTETTVETTGETTADHRDHGRDHGRGDRRRRCAGRRYVARFDRDCGCDRPGYLIVRADGGRGRNRRPARPARPTAVPMPKTRSKPRRACGG